MSKKSLNLAEEYANLLRKKLGSQLKQVFLFGSQARGDSWEGSDYDILVIVDKRTPDIREETLDVSVEMMNRYDKLFAVLLYSEKEWQRAQDFPLAWNIKHEGIPV